MLWQQQLNWTPASYLHANLRRACGMVCVRSTADGIARQKQGQHLLQQFRAAGEQLAKPEGRCPQEEAVIWWAAKCAHGTPCQGLPHALSQGWFMNAEHCLVEASCKVPCRQLRNRSCGNGVRYIYMIHGRGMSRHGLHSADWSERHAYSVQVICELHQACLEAAPVALCHALQCMCSVWLCGSGCRFAQGGSEAQLHRQ